MRYYSPFPVAIPQRRARSHALLTRPPLDPKVSLDLHVLGLPPAFVLSQDQTLKLKTDCSVILDVRTSAHRPIRLGWDSHPSDRASRFHQKPKVRQTVKLTPVIGANPYRRDIQTLIHRTEPSRPHISSDICDVKEQEENQTTAP